MNCCANRKSHHWSVSSALMYPESLSTCEYCQWAGLGFSYCWSANGRSCYDCWGSCFYCGEGYSSCWDFYVIINFYQTILWHHPCTIPGPQSLCGPSDAWYRVLTSSKLASWLWNLQGYQRKSAAFPCYLWDRQGFHGRQDLIARLHCRRTPSSFTVKGGKAT